MDYPKKEKTRMHRMMVLIRKFEERTLELLLSGRARGSFHPSIGEEASSVGACIDLQKDDYLVTTHRGVGDMLAKGLDINKVMAEICGKSTGYCGGRAGSMHLIDMENSFLGANGIVGGGIPIAVGGALAISYRYEKRVTMCVLGDGAVNQGTFHEGLNLAAIWNLPIIFLVKNNLYALSTPVEEVCPTDSISVKAKAYAIPGETINGNDVEMVRTTVSRAIKRAREGKGPSLIECLTYRLLGHSKSDDRSYRTNEEERKWREREPIKEYKKKLINEGIASEEELALIDKEVEVDVNRALKFSLASTDPNPENLTAHVYVDV